MPILKEYLTETVKAYRTEFGNTFSGGEQKYVREHLLDDSLLEPCQMEIFETKGKKGAALFILHKTTLADMSLNVHTEATIDDIRTFLEKERSYFGIDFKVIEEIIKMELGRSQLLTIARGWIWVRIYGENPRELAHELLNSARSEIKSAQVKNIEKSTEELKKSIPKIPEKDRDEFMGYAAKIDRALEEIARIDGKVSEEIGGFRRIVGASKEFQDFRVFTTDVEDLKKTHVNKDVFVSEVKRLDEKIDKGLEGLNTRIEDLKAIKFWSKRTLLEIALAILAALATLYGAGVLRF